MKFTRDIVIFFLIIVVFQGCLMKRTEYPSSWDKVKVSEKSTFLINGNFKAMGQHISSEYPQIKHVSLCSVFNESDLYESCDSISFEQASHYELKVSVIHNNKMIKTKSLKEGIDYDYTKESLVLKPYSECFATNGVIGCEKRQIVLYLTENEDLVSSSYHYAGATFMFVVPIGSNSLSWTLFKRMK